MLMSCGHWVLTTWKCKVSIHENMFPQAGYKTFSSLSGSSVNMLMNCGHKGCAPFDRGVPFVKILWPCSCCAFMARVVPSGARL